MTRFLFSFSFLLLSLVMGVRAKDLDNGTFLYSISNGEVTITRYIGSSPIVSIPSSIDDYPVTTIYNLSIYAKNSIIKEIFIPESVSHYTGSIVDLNNNNKIRTIVLENGNFDIETFPPFYHPNLNDNYFDNLIVLGSCDKSAKALTGNTNSDNNIYKAGEIQVAIKGQQNLTVQMYLFKTYTQDRMSFDNSRLEYLLSALQKHGIDLNDIESIDLSQMSQDGKTINFNLTGFSAIPNAQVITHKTTINDMAENYTPQAFTGLISYSRSNTAGWNTVCLPFDVKESDFPAGTEIYQMSSDSEDAINLSRIEEGATLAAGTPCFIWSPQGTATWNLNIQGSIAADISAGTSELEHWTLIGSFNKKPLDAGYYKLNSAGDAFVKTVAGTSHVYPFRCYIAPTPNNSSAPARLGMGIDEEATITLVPDDRAPQQVKLYDLMGRPRQGNAAGLFVPAKR